MEANSDQPRQPHHVPVFLLGFMGSGKTTWGKKLASQTGRPFIDLDQRIVETAGMAIPEYFRQYGESRFRQLENEVLKSIPPSVPAIVSTGGGAPCFFDNMDWMNANGITIYFKLPPEALWNRLNKKSSIEARPALQGLSDEALFHHIKTKLLEREPHYSKAAYTVDQLRLKVEDLMAIIGE